MKGVEKARDRIRAARDDERGEATVEFIGLVFLLVVPVVYLVVALAQVQAGLFAAEAGAREAARVLAEDPADEATALAQIDLAFDDFHVASAPATRIGCRTCGGDGRDVEVVVSTSVPLPLLPGWAGERLALPISASAASLVEGVSLDD
ncbi:hypothetical protein [Actinomyces culturomici]|uniref:hypothetical protein n=1 Tax=Actinomyces culturomici TaxID=1926276 RepID=UPI000E207DDC|nr:hypothetical protein [Actinomyces culturomici]